jgi:phosphomannomutase
VFSENGLMAHKGGELLAVQSFKKHLGEDRLKQFINFTLHYIADLDIPIKRGTFIEFRAGMLVGAALCAVRAARDGVARVCACERVCS